MFCPCISNHLPIVYALVESNVTKESPEEVVILSQINASAIGADCHYVFWILAERLSVPNKSADNYTNYLSL